MPIAMPFQLVLHNATCLLPWGKTQTDIGIAEGKIAAFGQLAQAPTAEVFDAKGLHILPGLIDSHVHWREPGGTHKEDMASGSAQAALGGVTSVFEMPNTSPPTTTPALLAQKLSLAKGRCWVDHAFFLGACADNISSLSEWERLPGCAGIKLFLGSSTGSLLLNETSLLSKLLQSCRRRIACHCEDENRLAQRKAFAQTEKPETHPLWRDETCAILATQKLLELAKTSGARLHILHLSTQEELALLQKARAFATAEVTPQHLLLSAPECYAHLGTLAQINPPLRAPQHAQALWHALHTGLIDCLATDHAPHTREEKAKPYPQSPSGMPGLYTLLPLMLHQVAQGKLLLEQLVELTAHGPARVFGTRCKGRIALGYDADLVLVDLEKKQNVNTSHTRCGWNAFDGHTLQGWPVATLLRGHWVAREGKLVGHPEGRPIEFDDTRQAL
ncbi:MAG: dihydroorotase [Cystobacterineae bacterium]|nr:dihydroorotase [Cystobacterineae bacterium]